MEKQSISLLVGELKSSCLVKARLVFSAIGVFVGLSAGAVFGFHFKNYSAGLWGLCSGIAALVALSVTIAFMKGFWDTRVHWLKRFMLSGCFVQLAGVCGFVAYLVLAISKGQELTAYGQGFYIACVWCFMTWKWGFLLLIHSRTYHRAYEAKHALLNVDAGSSGHHPYSKF